MDRGWPVDRLREAFAVWRYGAAHVAEHSWDIAGRVGAEDLETLRRAVRRYERHVDAAPGGWPEGGLAALAEISIAAGERGARPERIHYAIRALDQLSRRIRASDTVDDPDRLTRRVRRAQRRVEPSSPSPCAPTFAFRNPARYWPRWVQLDERGDPRLVDGELVVVAKYRAPEGYEHQPWAAPPRSSREYLDTLRDAYLLRGLWPPSDADGRSTMAAGDDRGPSGLEDRRALPGPYPTPDTWRDDPEPEDLELARLAPAMSLRRVQRLDVDVRDRLLAELRRRRRDDQADATEAQRERLTRRAPPPDGDTDRDA